MRRLNPSGVPEGSWPRGYRPGPRNYTFDLGSIGPRDFVRQYGRAAYDAVPKRYIYRKGHRKSVAREYAEDFLQQAED